MKFPCCCVVNECIINSTIPEDGLPFTITPSPTTTTDGSIDLLAGDEYILEHEIVPVLNYSLVKLVQFVLSVEENTWIRIWYEYWEDGDDEDITDGSGAFIEVRVLDGHLYSRVHLHSGTWFFENIFDDRTREEWFQSTVILDRHVSGYRIFIQTDGHRDITPRLSGDAEGANTAGVIISLSPIKYDAGKTAPVAFRNWGTSFNNTPIYFPDVATHSRKIRIDCFEGSGKLEVMRLFEHLTIEPNDGCATAIYLSPTYATPCAGGPYIAYTLPTAIAVTLPIWVADPDFGVGVTCCGDGGGDTILFVRDDEAGVFEQACVFKTLYGYICGTMNGTIRLEHALATSVEAVTASDTIYDTTIFMPMLHSVTPPYTFHTDAAAHLMPDDVLADLFTEDDGWISDALDVVSWNARVVIDYLEIHIDPLYESNNGDAVCIPQTPSQLVPYQAGEIIP